VTVLRLGGKSALVSSVIGLLVLVSPAIAAFECEVSYIFLFADHSGFYFIENTGGDCEGTHLKKLIPEGDSVRVEEIHDWKQAPQSALGTRSSVATQTGLTAKMTSADGDWSVEAPSHKSGGLLDRHPPVLAGLDGKPVYWDGCGKYTNYQVKAAIYDSELGYLVVVTHSNWSSREAAYKHDCIVGDGLVLFKIKAPH